MKLTVLVDNNTFIDKYYYGEPAVSYYIEAGDKRLLFDAGYSDIFLQNAEKMGIDLSKLTHIVLSHGHNDHSNGLQFLTERVGIAGVELIAHPDCFLPKYDEDEYIVRNTVPTHEKAKIVTFPKNKKLEYGKKYGSSMYYFKNFIRI